MYPRAGEPSMSHWHQIIRSGDPTEDQRQLAVAHQHAAGQGLVLRVQPLAQGGFQVEAVPPGMPPQGYGPPPQPMVAYAQAAPVARMAGGCQACGRHAPTKRVSFSSNIGLIVARIPRTIDGNLCRRCISSYFWKFTGTSALFGWWGVISFFYTCVTIPMNIVTFLGARDVPEDFPGQAPGR
jgi:hypothetical protein